MTLRDPMLRKPAWQDRLHETVTNMLYYDWIFETWFEKIFLMIMILLGMYGLYDLIKGVILW